MIDSQFDGAVLTTPNSKSSLTIAPVLDVLELLDELTLLVELALELVLLDSINCMVPNTLAS